jgi:hypothetical protein
MRGYINAYDDYVYQGFGGVDNCDYCDQCTHITEWLRPDGFVSFICERCRIYKRFPEIKA